MKFFKAVSRSAQRNLMFCNESTRFDRRLNVMSAVAYDVCYDTRMIKTRKNMVTMRLLAAIKTTLQDIDRPNNIKISKHTTIFKL